MSEINTIRARYKAVRRHFNSPKWILMRYVLTNGHYGHWQNYVGVGHPLGGDGWAYTQLDPNAVLAVVFETEEEALAMATADALIS